MKNIYFTLLFGIFFIIGHSHAQTIVPSKKEVKSINNSSQINSYIKTNPGITKPDITKQKTFIANIKLNHSSSNSFDPINNHQLCDHANGHCDTRNLPLSKNGKLLSVDGFEVTFEVPSDTNISKICYTPRPVVNGSLKDASCPFSVPCDNPNNRDAAPAPTKYFQLVWHVMQSTSGGTSSNINQSRIDALMTELNADFAAYNMIFCTDPANFYVDDANYNHNENTEEVSLKNSYVTTPTQFINIYVVGSMGPGGYARFPYDPMGGTSNTGGIVLNRGNCNVGTHTLAHEMGHVFGLEHTFSGVDERSQCSSCYEKVRNPNGSSNTSGTPTANGGPYNDEGDREGDWCSDTNPHDTYSYNCSTSNNSNGSCDSDPWANAPVNNHMSYSFCSSTFTDQQGRRMHCMTNTYLSSWTAYGGGTCGNQPPVADFLGTPLYGTATHTVNFTDLSQPNSLITQWDWNFDVGGLGGVTPATFSTGTVGINPPAIAYANPGIYDVSLTIQSANGNSTEIKNLYVEVISPPNTCDTLYTQWETPTPSPTIYSFAPPGGLFTGTPCETLQATPGTDAIEFTERFATAGPGSSVGGVRIGLGNLYDADGDMTFDIFIWDDNAGEPDWLAAPSAGGYLGGETGFNPTTMGVPGTLTYQEIWIPFDNEVVIPGAFFHVGINMNPGDATDSLLVVSSCDHAGCGPQGENDNSNHVWSSAFGTLSYQNDIATDFDLDIVPMLEEYTPETIIIGFDENVVCDTTYVTLTDTTYYTDWTNLASVEYRFSDGQNFIFAPPTSANNVVSTYFTTPGPVTFDIIAVGSVCGRTDTNSYILPYNFMTKPDADFTKDLSNPICTTSQPITFTANTTGYSDYTWDFGDGTVTSSGSTDNLQHTYAGPGTYYVSLTTMGAGYQPADTLFLEQFEGGIPGTWATFDNDGATPNAAVNPPWTGTNATAWLSGDYTGSGDDEATSTSWNVPPTTAADDWLISPQIMVNANSSLAWDGEAISSTYNDGYEVYVTTGAQNAAGCQSGTMVYSTTGENSFRTTHNVDLAANGYASQNVRVCFRNNSTDMFLLAIDNVRIGTTGPGCSFTEQKLDYVTIVDCAVPVPVTDGDADVMSGCAPLTVNFSDITTGGDPATSWLWNFDDGTFDISQNPGSHTFNNIGVYNVQFESCNSGGCTTETIIITVSETPTISSVNSSDPTTCTSNDGQIIIAAAVSSGTLEYSIDNGANYQASNTFTGLSAGTYDVAVRNGGCEVFSSITLNNPTGPSFTISNTTDPSTCTGNDGTIEISGLAASTSYDITYDDDGITTGPITLTSNGSGIINIAGLNAGTYDQIIVSLSGCPTSDPGPYLLTDPSAPTFTVSFNNPSSCLGTDGEIIISGLSNSINYNITYDDDGITTGPSPMLSNALGEITITGLNAGTYDQIIVELAGCSTTDPGTITLADPSAPAFSVASNDPTTCLGTDGELILSGLSNSTIYDINYDDDGITIGPNSLASNGSGVITISGLNAGTYDQITVSLLNCGATDAGTFTLTDPTTPSFTVSTTNPTTCNGTDGELILSGLTNSTIYNITYDDDGITTGPSAISSNGSGTITITGLNAGSYTNVIVTLNNCSTTDPGAFNLTDPTSPSFTVATTDPSTCGNTDGSLILSGLNNATNYDITYNDNSITTGPTTMMSNGSGIINITGLDAGTYDQIIVTLNGCSTTDPSSYVLADPSAPTFTIAGNDPTTCGGTDGNLTLSGLNNSTSYNITYTNTIGIQGPTAISSDASGNLIIPNLNADSYSNIQVELAGCIGSVPGPFTLTEPGTPTFTISTTNPTTCGGTDGTLEISGLTASTSYDISYDDDGTTIGPSTMSSNTSGNITISGLDAGTYDVITVDLTGCITIEPGSYNISDPATNPTFTVTTMNTSSCAGTDGSVTINGLLNNTLYNITYTDGSGTTGPSAISSDGSGTIIISSLSADSYTNIIVDILGCSTTDTGPYTITDPALPTFSVSGTTNPSSCGGTDGSVDLNGLTATTTYTINYDDNSVPTGPFNISSDALGNLTISGLDAGTYNNISVTLNGCIATDAGNYALTDPAAPTFTISSTDPTTCGGNDGSITISGLNSSTIYDITYIDAGGIVGPNSIASDGAGNIILNGLNADTYSAFIVDLASCNGNDPGPYVLTDPSAPTFSVASTNPTSCGNLDGTITLSGMNSATTYNISYTDISGTVGPISITSDASGNIVLGSLGADNYSNITVGLNGCSTTDNGPYVLTDPSAPTFTISSTNPTTCGGNDGTITINGLTGSTTYTITYSDISGTVGPSSITSDASGNIILGSLNADSYSNITVDLIGCSTIDNGPYVLTDPLAPTFSITTSDPTTCGGNDGSITINGLIGSTTYNITYTDISGVVGPSSMTSNASGNIIIGSLAADSYSTLIVDLIGCNTTDNGPYVLTDPTAPTFTITTSDPTSCGGTDGSITISGLVGSISYNVTYDDPIGTIGPNILTTDASGNITLSGLGAGNYQNFIIELSGCSTADNGPYSLSDPAVPNAPTAGTDNTYCEGDAFSDMTASGGTGTFNWYDDAGLTNNIGTGATQTPTITSSGSTTYYVTETENGCTGSASMVVISIDALPTIADAGNDTTICDTISSIVFNGNTPIIGSGIWTISSGSGIFTDSTLENTSVSGFSSGTNDFIWSISNGICPASTSTVTIFIEECVIPVIELVVPSGFTPDNSPPNDTWEIIGIEQYPECQIDIYNKWGNKVFSSKGYNEEWDGTYNGKPLPVSTYYYVIVLNDGSTPLKGTITIIK